MSDHPPRLTLVVVRHGPAEIRDPSRWPADERRPLTPKGLAQTRRAARGIARLVPELDVLATSAAVRAKQTAEALRAAYSDPPTAEEWKELAIGALAGPILDRLAELPRAERTVAVVGHEPALAELVGIALVGESVPVVQIGKASAVRLEFSASVRPGAGRLRWALPRKQLSALRTGRAR
jgi:phosphohistidine phosphatase